MTGNTELPAAALRDAVPQIPFAWLQGRRWFSSKGRTVQSITVDDWGVLALDRPAIVALALVQYAGGRDERYFLPLVASRDEQPDQVQVAPAGTIEHAGARWFVHDAFQFAPFQRLLMEQLLVGGELRLAGGRLVFHPEEALRNAAPPLAAIRLVSAEQSNTSIIYDRQAILKCFRRIVAGVNPDVEVSRFLSTRAGFPNTPAMLGSIAYFSDGGLEHSVGVLQSFVPNDGDAWEHVLQELGTFLATARGSDAATDEQIEHETHHLTGGLLEEIRHLGRLTGAMHGALASDAADPDFAPRPLTREHVTAWQASIRAEADAILGELERRARSLPPAQGEAVAALLAARPRIEARIDQLTALGDAGVVVTRFHGDYHLGQILASERGPLILDFEGEPLRTLAERRAHSSPLKDVAGMLRSLSYAASTALAQNSDMSAWTAAWERLARAAFCEGYAEATAGAPFVPRQPELRDTAIAVFELEKALYELNYELNNRPDWLSIPLRGIQQVV
jgi:maltose alpha-D-glucosyltransferase / alpha-amylase